MPAVTAGTAVPKRGNRGYPNSIFKEVPHDLFKLTTADENVLDSPFEGGESSELGGQTFFAQENDIFLTSEPSRGTDKTCPSGELRRRKTVRYRCSS